MALAPNVPNPTRVFGQPKLPGQQMAAPAAAPAAPAAPDTRQQYTGTLGAGVDTGAGSAQNTAGYAPQVGGSDPHWGRRPGDPYGPAGTDFNPVQLYRDGSGNLTSNPTINGVPLQPVDKNGAPIPQKTMTSVGQWENYSPYSSSYLGGDPNNPYSPGGAGSFAGQANAALQMQGALAQNRTGPQLQTGAADLLTGAAGQTLGAAGNTNYVGVGNALNLAGTANGAGYQGTMSAADRLMQLGQMPAGPSVAQQQLQQGADAAMQQQMAMAAGARGGNAGLALQNAGQNQGQIMGNLNAQMGIQRAQEDMANRQFAGQMTGAAGQMFGQGAGIQQAGYSAAGQQLQGIAGNQVQQAGVQAGLAGTYAGLAGQQLGADVSQRALNDQTMLASQGMGYDILNKERAAVMAQQQNNANENIAAYGINKGVDANAALQRSAQQNDWMQKILGGSIAAGGAILAPFTGGASAAAIPAGATMMSDIRAKKNIKPADAEVSDAFRVAGQDANAIRGASVQYPIGAPAYSYEYKNASASGAAPGTHYGPMAQDLEKTPAGASVVVQKPDGTKAIDTSRLALLNTSELAKQRAELDALKNLGAQTPYAPGAFDLTAYDTPAVPAAAAAAPMPRVVGVQGRAPVARLSPANFAQFGVPGSLGAGY